jgi:CRP-like cAMP-binding protein
MSAALLSTLPFFENFQTSWLEGLAKAAVVSDIKPGDYLLTQGSENSKIFFLLSGQLEVVVDNQPVATLEKRGDLFGEMSVISSQKVAASVRALTASQVLWIEAKELSKSKEWSVHEIQHMLFQLYSRTLTEKLKATNQKAKFFELTNRELERTKSDLEVLNRDLENKVFERTKDIEQKKAKLEIQNTELVLNQRKLEQLYLDRDMTFKKLEDLYQQHLLPLQFSFDYLRHHTEGETSVALAQASHQLQDVLRLMEPLNSLMTIEKAVKTQQVLFAEPEKRQQVIARLALGGSGVGLDVVSNLTEASPLIAQRNYDIVFFHPDCKDVALHVLESNPMARLVLVTAEHPAHVIPTIRSLKVVPNIVSRSTEDRVFSIKNISTTVAKLAAQNIFGIEKYLSWSVDVQTRPIKTSSDRSTLAAQVDAHFNSLGVRKTVRDRVLTVLEEMLMNAIYDAPTDDMGKSLYNHLPRTVSIELAPKQEGRLSFATDGVVLGVSVRDPFGSLQGETILNYLETCYGGAAGSLNAEKGGAGRGLHQIVENSDLVVFNLYPRSSTEVIALFNVDPKERTESFPSFHLFIDK